jgi:hypothetical protein
LIVAHFLPPVSFVCSASIRSIAVSCASCLMRSALSRVAAGWSVSWVVRCDWQEYASHREFKKHRRSTA